MSRLAGFAGGVACRGWPTVLRHSIHTSADIPVEVVGRRTKFRSSRISVSRRIVPPDLVVERNGVRMTAPASETCYFTPPKVAAMTGCCCASRLQ